eukprot:TRINITY_DN4343_c7_g1_i1.p1 TRINITY_DN4343_c7_g1~~TRINITY_DN4343_c7_g1_i1.p1  ORF type:complete len:162 (+),score=18.17 TRINITY_DN4343_c7_g1_i1:87-572(+)
MLASFPKDTKRRVHEVYSGYAALQLRSVYEEISKPSVATESEFKLISDPKGYASPLVTSAVSAVGVSYLARCVGIARFDHVAASPKSRRIGAIVGSLYFLGLATTSVWYRYSEVLERVICPAEDSPFAQRLRQIGRSLAHSTTQEILDAYEKRQNSVSEKG